jgi:hypothetical protein
MKFCPNCGTQNQDAANFCARCGGGLPAAPPRAPDSGGEDFPREAGQMPPRQAPPHGAPYAPPSQPGAYPPPPPGYPQPFGGPYPPRSGYQPPDPRNEGLDSGERIAVILGSLCISPIVAVVLYFVWKNDKPQKASEVCTIGWWVVGGMVALYTLFFLVAVLSSV